MFKKSVFLCLLIIAMVFVSSFASQWMASSSLPSSYDPGLRIDKAFKSAKTPLLIEFYSDVCGTCQRMAPIVHDLMQNEYPQKLTLVMMDVNDPENLQIAKLFGVNELPSIFVFDFKHMKKHQIDSKYFSTKGTLTNAIDQALVAAKP